MAPADGRTPVTRGRALREAVALADEDGLAAVTMRKLAARLGVVPMALYKHVEGKEGLRDGMVDELVSSIAPSDPSLAWNARVRHTVLAARELVLAHPWLRTLIETRTRRTPAVLEHMERVTGAFLAGGFSPDLTHHAMHALGHRIWGFSPEAFDAPGVPDAATPPPDPEARAQMVDRMARQYPSIAAVALATVGDDLSRLDAGCDEQFEFEFALDLLLDAVERLRDAGWSSPRR
ncbi:TetR/AcrR family transcriptional regulator [Brachybacterium sp. GCM10030252]|uniref:TetR/AcrR family transcriptional regulator n=1 Tax=Brachybacterium sp. GCM10030252 TaxID=3273380 RepID=UPI003620D50D